MREQTSNLTTTVVVLTMACCAACTPRLDPEKWQTSANLTTRFAVATVHREARFLELGTPEARQFLLSGWSEDREGSNGQRYVVSVGERSELRFPLVQVRDLPLTFRCRPLAAREWSRQVTVQVNGAVTATVTLDRRAGEYSLELPAQYLARGENHLELIYGDGTSAESGPRAPGVRWFSIEIGTPGSGEAEPFADAERGVLFIPYGVQVDFPVTVDDVSHLWIERIDFSGGDGPRLSIRTIDDSGENVLASFASSSEGEQIDLGRSEPDAILLSLRAESDAAGEPGDGVYLDGPLVRAPDRSDDVRLVEGDRKPYRPNVLVYLVDTLRTDRLSTYGYERPTSPRLDDFAEQATLFEKAVGQSSWTRPSVASLFVGTWPGDHSVTRRTDALSRDAETLAEILQRSGYRTAAFSTNPNVAEPFGFAQGFDHFDLMLEQADSTDANRAVFDWLDRTPLDEPFFLYVQPADPHTPYLPPEPFRSRLAADAIEMYERVAEAPEREIWESDPETMRQLNALYDAEIAANDASFGALLDHLDELGLLDEMLVVFLSDHGEEFREHGGWTHGRTLHVETLDFPLLVKLPGQQRPGRVGEIVQHVDILPTLTDLLAIDTPARAQGRSLVPYLEARGPTERIFPLRPVFSHVSLVRGLTTSIVVGEWKLIDRQGGGKRETHLYRWTEDQSETDDLASRLPIKTQVLRSLLDEKIASTDRALAADEAILSPEIEERLRALGYL